MVKSCSAVNCTTRYKKGVRFHQFPKDADLRKRWLIALKSENYKPPLSAAICGNHFKESDYTLNDYGRRVLIKEAVPMFVDNRVRRPKPCKSVKKQVIECPGDCQSTNHTIEEQEELGNNFSTSYDEKAASLETSNCQTAVCDGKTKLPSGNDSVISNGSEIMDKDSYQVVKEVVITGEVDDKHDYLIEASNEQYDPLSTSCPSQVAEYNERMESPSESDKISASAMTTTVETIDDKGDNEDLMEEKLTINPTFVPHYNALKSTCDEKIPFHHKRVISVYRYMGDIKNVDFSIPQNARRCLDIALGCVDNQKRKIRNLHKQNRNLNKHVHMLECEIQKILSREVINQSGGVIN